jgi:RNase H-fold protein (predicted Holliday junction resolvase)
VVFAKVGLGERRSTFAAEEAAEQAGLRGKKRAAMLDVLAAAAMLQDVPERGSKHQPRTV